MAEGSVSFLLNKLAELLYTEANLLSEVRAEAEYIRVELEFMRAFLRAVDAVEETDSYLKVFSKTLRDVVYDIEDALDDFRLRLASDDQGHGLFSFIKKTSHCVTSSIPRHRIASKMRHIKSRVINISEEHRRYLISHGHMMDPSSSSSTRKFSSRRDHAFPLEGANPVGIESPRKMLIDWLVNGNSEREVVAIVGMAGLGKTTLARNVYDDTKVRKHFEFRAWITLSQSFKTQDLLRDIIQQLFRVVRKPDPQGMENMNIKNLRTVIKEFLQKRRYLIVLDDVWDIPAWDGFHDALPNNDDGSRILLTTRKYYVAAVSSPDKSYALDSLSEKESLALLCKKVFRDKSCPPLLENVVERILVNCSGLPLAIVAISGILATKDKNTVDEWELVYRSLNEALQDNAELTSILSLSYNDLPYYLKSCLLYFGVFPKGDPIERMKLVRLWIAEGFVQEREGMTLEEVAEDYLNDLINRSLVQVAETTGAGRVKTCRLHQFLHEIIISKSRDQNFVAIIGEGKVNWPDKVRRISIRKGTVSLTKKYDARRLRSLLMFSGFDSSSEPRPFQLSSIPLRLLNVLDLEGSPLTKFPNEILSLQLLKYLSLKNTKVNSVPGSIGRLQHLETLNLKHCQISELPVQILKLQKLRHLLVYRYEIESDDQIYTKYGCKFPARIGSLQSVQKLCFVEANLGGNLLTEISKLNLLRRLGIVKLRQEDGRTLCSSIERLRNLRALSVTSTEEKEIIDMENLESPPQFLQRLYLTGRLVKIPEWISSLDSLVKLVLKWSGLSDDPLISLQYMPNLIHLEFVEVYDGQLLGFQAKGFQRLKFLGLCKLQGLKTIVVEQGAMPHLERLIIHNCPLIQRVPIGIEHLSELRVLEFFNMPSDLAMSLHPHTGNDGDYLKVAHVPEVYFSYWNDGKWDIFFLESFKQEKSISKPGPSIIKRPPHIWKDFV